MSYLDRINDCNHHDRTLYRDFKIAGVLAGRMRHAFADRLRVWEDVFKVGHNEVTLSAELERDSVSVERRSECVCTVLHELHTEGVIDGWRDEIHKISNRWSDPPLLLVERASMPHFGATGVAVHMNGYVRQGKELALWVARRADTKPTAPGKLDHLVAGGQPAHLGLFENLIKECAEEAGIARSLAKCAKSTGFVSYAHDSSRGYRPEVAYTFDLELPDDFEPVNKDGEVAGFFLSPVEEVAELVRETRQFKSNCALVIVDFLVRHGVITAEEPGFCDIVSGLRR